MAHCNRNDNSWHDVPPLRSLETSQKIVDPVVSPRAFVHLGAFTGEHSAVCVYDSPLHPALVAYDYRTGSVLWTSPPEDLPGLFHRWPSGILLARVVVDNSLTRYCVFAANPVEFVAYAGNGRRLWKRSSNEISADAPAGVGMPTSLTFTDRGEIVCVTTKGWIVKLDPLDGSVISSYRMEASLVIEGREYQGVFVTTKSPVVIGDVLYIVADFKPNVCYPPLLPLFCPVHLLRIELSHPGNPGSERQIRPMTAGSATSEAAPDRVQVGIYKGTGSPPALVRPGCSPLLFAHAHSLTKHGLQPMIAAVEDRNGTLTIRWQTTLEVAPGDDVYAAPALYPDSGTLLVTTLQNVYLFRDVASASGSVPCPAALDAGEMVAGNGHGTTSVRAGSPFGLAFDADRDEIVAYTNLRITTGASLLSYGFLGAFAIPVDQRARPYPLWKAALGVTADGAAIPGFGTFGQPACFRYEDGSGQSTGVIVNTVATGTYIFR